MAGYRRNDALMCLIFSSSLGELGLKWFERLPEENIERWQQLTEVFLTRFKTNTKTPKEVDHLLSVKIELGNSLKAYNAKYWETFNEILDCPTNSAIIQYKCGLPVGHRLQDSLTMNQPTTMELLMQCINEHIRVEDNAIVATAKVNLVAVDKRVAGKVHTVGQEASHPNNCNRDSNRGVNRNNRGKGRKNDRANYPRDAAGITTAFKIPIYYILSEIRDEAYIRFPAKLGDLQRGFNSRYCYTYNDECGHRIEDCVPLKQHIEELVVAGHLDRYIDGGVMAVPHAQTEPNGLAALEVPPQCVINVIHGIVEPSRVYEL
ncbi:uncharacterized protein LOC114319862 [Camellia sinensis]|uniref:uncharacterized protein LOC114319862 n=1 Tax=Camellia sinensis TaxID=4442 RepID=UPI0010357BA4|nr:uncharacterized protein LOC114319862 [Camellia sinensis]